ncbi:hypothetical protein OSB04_002278 [Centaurea solstitialis]|uniref:Association with the SNF1 complex (ASC) domain-containing protein n=1 Tax=Centaurea solstitialis TaxID=347529 RepID=A0AA38WM76_9ASTR|nr:hypothetical protein OSB04_002278 [Centaurea solstitialis]
MGNINGKEGDAAASSMGVGGGGGGGGDGDVDGDGGHNCDDGDFMAHSPPPSPRVSASPLMFTSQATNNKVILSRTLWLLYKDLRISRQAIHGCIVVCGYEEMSGEQQGIPTMITWSYDAKEVAVQGSWDNWKSRMDEMNRDLTDIRLFCRKSLQKSGKDFTILKVLPSGVYQYRFIVDGQWRYSPDMPWTQDESGNTCNILDLQEYVPEDIESISGFEPPGSPDSSYNHLQLDNEDYAKEPPLVPPHLQMTLLNVPSPHMEIPPPSSRPQHVVLNHLYMQKGRTSTSIVALGSTNRFLSKYVTVVLYKPIQR